MKKSLAIFGIVFVVIGIVFYFYVSPFGKKVDLFENRYSSFHLQVESAVQNLNGDRFESYPKALKEMPDYKEALSELVLEHKNIIAESNIIKKLWKTVKITQAALDDLQGQINNLYPLVSPGGINAIKEMLVRKSEEYRSSAAVDKINTATDEYNSYLKELSISFQSLDKHISDSSTRAMFSKANEVDLTFLGKMRANLESTLSEGCNALKNIIEKKSQQDMSLIESAQSAKQVVDLSKSHISWIESAGKTLASLANAGAPSSECKAIEYKLSQLASYSKADVELVDRVIEAQKRCNSIMKNALNSADSANNSLQNMERFASSGQISTVYGQWNTAYSGAVESRNALAVQSASNHQVLISNNLLREPRGKVDNIINNINSHRQFVYGQYQEASRQESTLGGSVTRTVQRGINRLGNLIRGAAAKVAESRIGREISISVKALILGTKAFYDLMDPNTDPMSWAFSYQGDVDQLMKETDDVMRMPGASITGKNTIIEEFVNKSYDSAFRKK